MSSIDWSKISEARVVRQSETKPTILSASIEDRIQKSKPAFQKFNDRFYSKNCRLSRFSVGARVYIWPIRGNDPQIKFRGKLGIVGERLETGSGQLTKYVRVPGSSQEFKVSVDTYFLTDEEYTLYSVMET